MPTNNEVRDIIEVIKSQENRGISLNETAGKVINQK